MRRSGLLLVVALLLVSAGCSAHASAGRSAAAIATAPTGPPSTGDLPPAWVQKEALWQSLDAGDAHPQSCRWLLLDRAQLSAVAGKFIVFRNAGPAYLVVVRGHFQTGYGAPAKTLFLVLDQTSHNYLAVDFGASRLNLARVGRLRVFTPHMPYTAGVWAHAVVEGGPAPGPRLIPGARVAIWKGGVATGRPFMKVVADAGGFFSLDLPTGTYTFALTADADGFSLLDLPAGTTPARASSGSGYPRPVTVTVVRGRLVSARVISDEM
jgi:hypothetical protein